LFGGKSVSENPLFFNSRYLVLLPSVAVARVIPLNRLEMFHMLQFHPVDRLVLITFSVIGPFTGWFIYWQRDVLQHRAFGGILFVLLFGYVLWLYRQQQPEAISDSVLIAVWGAVLPVSVLVFGLFISEGTPISITTPTSLIFFVHLVAQTLFIATLYVRRQTRISWPVMFWILMLALLALLILVQDLVLGLTTLVIAVTLIGLLWFLGETWLRRYLWSHSSFWLMQIGFLLSIFVWAWKVVPWWASTSVYLIVTAMLARWAYVAGGSASTQVTSL
jgi:hypothetical protein